MEHEAYLDNASTTKPRPEVIRVMQKVLEEDYGNASALHSLGRRAHTILEESREVVAQALGVEPDEIYFTSGGTESNNLAVRGACRARGKQAGQIITSALEHPSVTRSVRGLKREGWPVSYVEAVEGNFDLASCEQYFQKDTILATVMTVQNELGYIMPIQEVCDLRDKYAPQALVHTDAVQALGKVPLPLRKWGVDMASFSAHKIGGPKGIGALYVKRGTHLFTTAFGGGQERGLRSGTEAVFLIAGFAEAMKQTYATFDADRKATRSLWNYLVKRLRSEIPSVIINSREDGSPYICNITIPGMNNQKALDYLSDKGIYISKAAACESNHTTVAPGTWRPKHPLSLQAAGIPLSL
ncbi:MAG: cysteine desulfurase family protein, partial [Eggerthellaceae bacterium]|nr:cysteine desulfurase family protein [Eggerthellaceae bacterium]